MPYDIVVIETKHHQHNGLRVNPKKESNTEVLNI